MAGILTQTLGRTPRRSLGGRALACLCTLTWIGLSVSTAHAENLPELDAQELTQRLAALAESVHYGGLMVASGDTLRQSVVVIAGSLDIQSGGALAGDAWIVNGRLILTGRAAVLGSLDLVNSETYLSHEARITGPVRRYRCECKLDGGVFDREQRVLFVEERDPRAVHTQFTLGDVHVNRVDYAVVKLGLERRNPRAREPYTRSRAMLHVPWRRNDRGFLGFDLSLAIPIAGERADLEVSGFKETTTRDDWQLSQGESSAALLLGGTDLCDYYERQGGRLGVRWRIQDEVETDLAIGLQRDLSLQRTGTPSFLYPHRSLPENPSIDDGERLLLRAGMTLDTRYDADRPRNAWRIQGVLERGWAAGPGDFRYLTFTADVRRYTALPFGLLWAQRARVYSGYERMPRQLTATLHGVGGVRGVEDRPFDPHRGDRLALLSTELRAPLPRWPVLRWIFTRPELMLFADVGLVTTATNPEAPLGFLDAPLRDWRKGAGIGIGGESFLPYIGLILARDLDQERDGMRIILRAQRSF